VLAVHNYTGVDVVRQGGVTKYVIGFGWSKNWRTFRPSSRSWSGVPLLDPQEVVKAIGKTQPFRPVISLSVPLAELKDLPKLIRQIELHHLTNLRNHGIDPKKVAAGDFLAWKFGVAPLLKDISTLFELGKKVDARLKLLEESLSRGYYGANVSLSSTDLYLPEYVSSLTRPAYFGGGPKVTWHFAGKRRRWAYVRWVPLTGAREKIRQALRVWAKFEDKTLFNVFAAGAASKDPYSLFYKFLGISNAQAVASVWELSPWSWLVDWLIPLGDLLQSSIAGNIPWQSSHGCIMEEDTFRFVIDSIDVAKPSHGSLQQQLTAKVDGPVPVRFVRRVVPDILDNTQLRSDLPVLDKNQMAILLALVLQRLP
jgi:hypothetical protein